MPWARATHPDGTEKNVIVGANCVRPSPFNIISWARATHPDGTEKNVIVGANRVRPSPFDVLILYK
jgi:hypothetical protein